MSGEVYEKRTRGFVYVAWGEKFIQESIQSAISVKSHMNYPIALITTADVDYKHPFDQVIKINLSHTYRDKISMRESPFMETIFLDTDTFVMESLDQIFELLSRFDIAYQPSAPSNHYTIGGMPMLSFYEPSAGIVAWRSNNKTSDFFDAWDREYTYQERENGDGAWDQRSMRAALWKTDVQIAPLGPDWQLYSFEAAILMNKVKMVHGRGDAAITARRICNSSIGPRLFMPRLGITRVWQVSPSDYAKLSILSAYAAARRLGRLLIHWLRIKPLPANKRPA